MSFLRDIVGHSLVIQSLCNALASGRVSHAYLFNGPAGVGKKTVGWAFARALLCRRGDGDACGGCDDCVRTGSGMHPDLKTIRPDGAFIKIAQLRSIQGNTVFSSFGEGRQVYLIEQAEKMTSAAANCFLKTLEDPPPGVTFILVADDHAGMLPTILSRCQNYRLNAISERDVLQVLERQAPGAGTEQVKAAAKISMGCPGRALTMLDGSARRDEMLALLQRLVRERPLSSLAPVEELDGRDKLVEFIDCSSLFFRDALAWQVSGNGEVLMNVDRTPAVIELAQTYDKRDLLDILLTLEKAARMLAGNVNQRLVLDTLVFSITGAGSEREV